MDKTVSNSGSMFARRIISFLQRVDGFEQCVKLGCGLCDHELGDVVFRSGVHLGVRVVVDETVLFRIPMSTGLLALSLIFF